LEVTFAPLVWCGVLGCVLCCAALGCAGVCGALGCVLGCAALGCAGLCWAVCWAVLRWAVLGCVLGCAWTCVGVTGFHSNLHEQSGACLVRQRGRVTAFPSNPQSRPVTFTTQVSNLHKIVWCWVVRDGVWGLLVTFTRIVLCWAGETMGGLPRFSVTLTRHLVTFTMCWVVERVWGLLSFPVTFTRQASNLHKANWAAELEQE